MNFGGLLMAKRTNTKMRAMGLGYVGAGANWQTRDYVYEFILLNTYKRYTWWTNTIFFCLISISIEFPTSWHEITSRLIMVHPDNKQTCIANIQDSWMISELGIEKVNVHELELTKDFKFVFPYFATLITLTFQLLKIAGDVQI